MKSELVRGKKQDPKPTFPALYRSREYGSVVLFTTPHTGTLLVAGEKEMVTLGANFDNWTSCTDSTTWERLGPEDSVVLTGGDL